MTTNRSLYVHSPWCLVKCPYCDFNAYAMTKDSNKEAYIKALIADFKRSMRLFPQVNPPPSIYFGGGTPSMIEPLLWAPFFAALKAQWQTLQTSGCEITMEVSPLIQKSVLEDFIALGVNRFSVGVQSFQEPILRLLGREHRSEDSYKIAEFSSLWPSIRWNIDIMYGLRDQTYEQVEKDLTIATSSPITHLSWYELMIEPGTVFARKPEVKATEEQLEIFEQAGKAILASWEHYEVSAYAKEGHYSRHNKGYWLYEDYLGIGAGAHSKVTLKPHRELRLYKTRSPKDYIRCQRFIQDHTADPTTDFLLSRLRLFQPLQRSELSRFTQKQRYLLEGWLETQRSSDLWLHSQSEDYELTGRGQELISDLLENWLDYKKLAPESK